MLSENVEETAMIVSEQGRGGMMDLRHHQHPPPLVLHPEEMCESAMKTSSSLATTAPRDDSKSG